MHVAVERLLAAVDHLDRTIGAQRQQAGMGLHRDILAAAERPTDARKLKAHLRRRQIQRSRNLTLVRMQPLSGDVEIDAAVLGGNGQARFRTEKCLILHPDLVLAGYDDLCPDVLRAPFDVHPTQHVADDAVTSHGRAVNPLRRRQDRGGRVRDRGQNLVTDDDLLACDPGCLGMIGSNDRDGFAFVADLLLCQHGLIVDLEPVPVEPGNVIASQHGIHAGQLDRLGDVDADDACSRMRTA